MGLFLWGNCIIHCPLEASPLHRCLGQCFMALQANRARKGWGLQRRASAHPLLGGCKSYPSSLAGSLAASLSLLFLLQAKGWGSLGDPTRIRMGSGAATSRQEGPRARDLVQDCHHRDSLTYSYFHLCSTKMTAVGFFQLQKCRKLSRVIDAGPEHNWVVGRRSYRGPGEALMQGGWMCLSQPVCSRQAVSHLKPCPKFFCQLFHSTASLQWLCLLRIACSSPHQLCRPQHTAKPSAVGFSSQHHQNPSW